MAGILDGLEDFVFDSNVNHVRFYFEHDEVVIELTYLDGSVGFLIRSGGRWSFPDDNTAYDAGYARACGYLD